ncbi:MAG: class C sortase [Stomatobaculum sp.]|nr:class C sortase [Stomatobaculum sp.]
MEENRKISAEEVPEEEVKQKKPRRRRIRPLDVCIVLVFLLGLCIMLYPAASDFINRIQVERALGNYQRMIQQATPEDYDALFKAAQDYNSRLRKNPTPYAASTRTAGYEETLRLGNSGIMGYVMIEKIRVRLPFYHGTEEDVLQRAIGHLEGSSLPIGEKGDHAVLSAHRGLPSAKLFTDLPELVIGDTFEVTVLNREMVYEVDQILTVLPDSEEAFEALKPVPGEDLVTLMTCTPYGVNTHRLLVRGHKTADRVHSEEGGSGIGSGENGSSFDRYIPYVAGAAVVIFLALWFMPAKKRKK